MKMILGSCSYAMRYALCDFWLIFMEEHEMAESSNKTSQIHVRVPPEFKKALKMFCVREGTTEQTWISELIETELKNKAPELWSQKPPAKKKNIG